MYKREPLTVAVTSPRPAAAASRAKEYFIVNVVSCCDSESGVAIVGCYVYTRKLE